MSYSSINTYTKEIYAILHDELINSKNYKMLCNDLNNLTVLADRIILASTNNPYLDSVSSINKNIIEALQYPTDVQKSGYLLTQIEKWLKAVTYFSFPDRFKLHTKNQDGFHFTTVLRELNLLEQAEIDNKGVQEFDDFVKSYFIFAKNNRNFETHRTESQRSSIKNNYLLSALITMFAPLYTYYDVIKKNLEGLVIRPVDSSIDYLFQLINNDINSKLKFFKGRENDVNTIVNKLTGDLREGGGYLIVTGMEGIGKSALCAKVSEQLIQKNNNSLLMNQVQKDTPWLPGQLLHFGKWEKNRLQIIRSLISQANAMLLRPVALPDAKIGGMEILPEHYLIEEDHFGQYGRTEEDFTNYRTDFENISTKKVGKSPSGNVGDSYMEHNSVSTLFKKDENIEIVQYQSLLFSTLKQLVEQHGPVVLIIDALDEISKKPEDFSFLPESLPEGVSALLTVRPNLDIDTWFIGRSRLGIEPYELKLIPREDIPKFTSINDHNGSEEKKFNDAVYKHSKGWSLQVADIARKLKDLNGDFTKINVEDESKNFFMRQQAEWKDLYPDQPRNKEILKEILHLLAWFEPVSPINEDDIHGYLEFCFEEDFDFNDVKELLKPVAYQIQGLGSSQENIKLNISAFAENVRSRRTKRDKIRDLQKIANWLIEDDLIESKLIGDFISYWVEEGAKKQVEIAQSIIVSFKENEDFKRIKSIASQSFKRNGKPNKAFVYASKVLAESGDPFFMYLYSSLLANGREVDEDVKEAEVWLRKAAQADHVNSMIILGSSLLDGEKFPKNETEGEEWLRKAIDLGSVDASIELGCRLIDGKNIEVNVEEGYEILDKAADGNSEKAMIIFANRLLDGKGIKNDPDKGKELLIRLADEFESGKAMRHLGLRLIDQKGLPKNLEEGEEWLRKAAELDDLPAIYNLGKFLFKGDYFGKNQEEGIGWLLKGAEKRFVPCMLYIANIYIRGIGGISDKNEGEKWLVEASKFNSKKASLNLGQYYLHGEYGFPANKLEAEKWLRKAVDAGSDDAMRVLGIEYLNGEILDRDPKKGMLLLRQSVNNNDMTSHFVLGLILLKGSFNVPRKPRDGERLLRNAVKAKHEQAMYNLADLLIEGEFLTQNKEEGLELLNYLVKENYPNAISNLAQRYYTGDKLPQDSKKATKVLLDAIERRSLEAMYILGQHLLLGKYVDQDVDQGRILLKQAADKGLKVAVRNYAKLLLNNEYFDTDEEQGVNMLESAYQDGDMEAGFELGIFIYKQKKLMNEAVQYFYNTYKGKYKSSAVSLLYMYRRKEIHIKLDLDINLLIEDLKKQGTLLSEINLALYELFLSPDDSKAWQQADKVFSSLKIEGEEEIEWWRDLAEEGDAEGHLVLAWLQRHNKILDPEGLTLVERFELAEEAFDVPHRIANYVTEKKKKRKMAKR